MRLLYWIIIVFCASPLSAATSTVILGPGSSFNPNTITVNVGDTVHWDTSTGTGGFHNVAPNGGSEPVANSAGGGWTYDFTFNNPGAFAYFCQIHGLGMSGVINVAPAPSNTSTPTPTLTETPVVTVTSTVTDVPPGSSPTFTATISPTPTETPVVSATNTPTPSCTKTPGTPVIQFFQGAKQPLLAPNPVKVGDPICLYMDAVPAESVWVIYNSAAERVARLSFGAKVYGCWDTTNFAPGLYYVDAQATLLDSSLKKTKQKVVLWR